MSGYVQMEGKRLGDVALSSLGLLQPSLAAYITEDVRRHLLHHDYESMDDFTMALHSTLFSLISIASFFYFSKGEGKLGLILSILQASQVLFGLGFWGLVYREECQVEDEIEMERGIVILIAMLQGPLLFLTQLLGYIFGDK